MLSQMHRTHRCSHRRIAGISPKVARIARKNGLKKHSNFIEILKTSVKMKTKTNLGKVRGVRSYFTDPCKNHIKAYQKASTSFFIILDSFHEVMVKIKRICNKNTHLRNALWNVFFSKPFENSMVCGIHLFANALPKPFGEQHRPKTQHEKASAQIRACVLWNVPACLKMSLPAPKL